MNIYVKVKYSCTLCGVHRVEVDVPARTNEDVVFWMQEVLGLAVSNDHRARSPLCESRTMSEVMIPLSGVDKLGGPIIQ
jgi:hypothetical protein